MNKQFLGLGKTKYSSSICLIDENNNVELLLNERLDRKKNSGAWPEKSLKKIFPKLNFQNLIIAENRDVHSPREIEDIYNTIFPFYEHLKLEKMDCFVSHFNPNIQNISHHLCHAHAALALSPFEKSIIIVMDGAGSELKPGEYEECSVFLQDGVHLKLASRQIVCFKKSEQNPSATFGTRIGACYEKASEFIFNSPNSSGKVMGLAPFGESLTYHDHFKFQDSLPWNESFQGKSKSDWESLDHTLFKNIAATVQMQIESEYTKIISNIRHEYPDYNNLILTGGCALNCTNNAKILYKKLFKKIYVPPFPGDECIGFGLANFLKHQAQPGAWAPVPFEKQSAYLGSIDSIPSDFEIEKEFLLSNYETKKFEDIETKAVELLKNKQVLAWFQGRSESGPRALGNRSILVHPDIPGLKDFLNSKIKFREKFRPFGCSVLHEKAHLYFEIEEGFDNPFMSFAIKIKKEFRNILKEVSHVDGTSRMQTVRTEQNQKFHKLIELFGNETGLFCLLNTSLNVMDEPILETVADAKRFMENSNIKYLIIGDYLISKKS